MGITDAASIGKWSWIVLTLALIVYGAHLLGFIDQNSATFDEGMHIAAGYRYWQCGDYGINPEHPPLLKLIAAVPIRHWQLDGFGKPCGASVTDAAALLGDGSRLLNSENGTQLLRIARRATIIFPLALLTLIFFATRTWFGPQAAIWATLLTVFEPNLTAHGALVTTDMAITATGFATVFCAWNYLQRPNAAHLVLLGVAMGLALASKHSGILIPFVVALEFAAYAWTEQRDARGEAWWKRSLKKLAPGKLALAWVGAGLIAMVVLWGVYGFRFSALPGPQTPGFELIKKVQSSGQADSLPGRSLVFVVEHHLLPESYVAGLIMVVITSVRETFLFGQTFARSVWYYFPAAISIKTTLTLLLFALAAVVYPRVWKGDYRRFVFLLVPIAVFLGLAMASGMGLGIRHVLPIYPFLIVLAAAAMTYFCERYKRAAVITCGVLVAFQAVSYARNFPNEIAYANEAWGGPKQLHRYLGDSNVDWGQSAYAVREYLARNQIHDCWIAWFGARDPELDGIPCKALPGATFNDAMRAELPPIAADQFGGTVLISASLTEYSYFPYRVFGARQPHEVIGGGVLVFHGNFHEPEVAADRRTARGWWYMNHGQAGPAIEELQLAQQNALVPANNEFLLGWALRSAGRLEEAEATYLAAAKDYEGRPQFAMLRQMAQAQADDVGRELAAKEKSLKR